jgi:hypothetical protein
MKKKKYDTSIVMVYLLGQEKLLPKEFRKTVPYSTISTWRKEKYEDYQGSEFRFLFDDNWDLIHLKHENRKLKSTLNWIENPVPRTAEPCYSYSQDYSAYSRDHVISFYQFSFPVVVY